MGAAHGRVPSPIARGTQWESSELSAMALVCFIPGAAVLGTPGTEARGGGAGSSSPKPPEDSPYMGSWGQMPEGNLPRSGVLLLQSQPPTVPALSLGPQALPVPRSSEFHCPWHQSPF